MQSSSTKLLQKVLWVKLQSWLKYINGERDKQYALAKKPAVIDILEHYDENWVFSILTLKFEDDILSIWGREYQEFRPGQLNELERLVAKIAYSDPEFYKTIFVIINRTTEQALTPRDFALSLLNL